MSKNYTVKAAETTLGRDLDTRLDADRRAILAELVTFAGGAYLEDRNFDPQTLRAVVMRHRYGRGLHLRIDGLELPAPDQWGTPSVRAILLHAGNGSFEPWVLQGWRMDRRTLPDGSPRLTARAVAQAARILLKPGGAWCYRDSAWAWVEGAARRTPKSWRGEPATLNTTPSGHTSGHTP